MTFDNTVLPAKSDSHVMSCPQSHQGPRIDSSLMFNPIRRIELILKLSIDSHQLKRSAQVNVLPSNCKQSIMSLSLLVGTTVECKSLKTCSVMSLNNVLTFYSYFVCYIKYILHKVIKDE